MSQKVIDINVVTLRDVLFPFFALCFVDVVTDFS